MKPWQKIWLYLLIVLATLHLLRDVFQDLNIVNFLSAPFVKPHPNIIPSWFKYNTYPVEILWIVLAYILLTKNRFGKSGYLTIVTVIFMFTGWTIYWFYL